MAQGKQQKDDADLTDEEQAALLEQTDNAERPEDGDQLPPEVEDTQPRTVGLDLDAGHQFPGQPDVRDSQPEVTREQLDEHRASVQPKGAL